MRRRTWFLWGVISGQLAFAPFFADFFGSYHCHGANFWFASAPWLLSMDVAGARELAYFTAAPALLFFFYTLPRFKHFRVEQALLALFTAALSAYVPFFQF